MRRLTQWALVWALVWLAWWALAEGVWVSLPVIGVASLFITWLAMHLLFDGAWHLNWRVLPGLLGFFMWQSLKGGMDVASRALAWQSRFESEVVCYRLRLPDGACRQVWLAGVGLFPGTMVVGLDGEEVRVHVLDNTMTVLPGLVAFEDYLLRLTSSHKEG